MLNISHSLLFLGVCMHSPMSITSMMRVLYRLAFFILTMIDLDSLVIFMESSTKSDRVASSYLVLVTWVRVLNHATIPQSLWLHPLNEPFVSFQLTLFITSDTELTSYITEAFLLWLVLIPVSFVPSLSQFACLIVLYLMSHSAPFL
jgi:hypothetical protein